MTVYSHSNGDKRQNKVQPLIVSTAHTVQGREVGPDGKVYLMYDGSLPTKGGWGEIFALNSVYVTCTRVRRRDQLVLVDISDLI